jgi:hypothetical protein
MIYIFIASPLILLYFLTRKKEIDLVYKLVSKWKKIAKKTGKTFDSKKVINSLRNLTDQEIEWLYDNNDKILNQNYSPSTLEDIFNKSTILEDLFEEVLYND